MPQAARIRGMGLLCCLSVMTTLILAAPGNEARAQQLLPCDFQSNGDYSGSYAKGAPGGPVQRAEGQRMSSLELIKATPRKSDFFKAKEG